MQSRLEKYVSPFGVILVKMTDKKIMSLSFLNEKIGSESLPPVLDSFFGDWLNKYIDGSLKPLPFKYLDLSDVTLFQTKVYQALWEIPFGQTLTYAQLAKKIGQPKACRAVGQANKRNPLPLVIPCHRVVASNGLGGYSCGLSLKKSLLQFEGVL